MVTVLTTDWTQIMVRILKFRLCGLGLHHKGFPCGPGRATSLQKATTVFCSSHHSSASSQAQFYLCINRRTIRMEKANKTMRTGKGQFSFQSIRKAMPKNAQTTAQLHSSHTLAKSCSKFSRPGFSSVWTVNIHMFKLVLEKAEEPQIKLPTLAGSSKKQESFRKISIYAFLTMPKPLTVWITINCGKFWKRWEYQTTWHASWGICMQVKKQQLELDMEQQTDSK